MDSRQDPIASRLQHTLFAPGLSEPDVVGHCEECATYAFNAVMLPGRWVALARDVLAGTQVRVASAVDFPYAAMTVIGRVAEAKALEDAGVDELDIGVPVGLLRTGKDEELYADIAAVVNAVRVPIKAMLELPLLEPDERDRAVRIAVAAGCRYLKNASGGSVGVATEADIRFLRAAAPATVGIKASGGIRTRAHAERLIAAGADLVGTSNGVEIVTSVPHPDHTDHSY
jgi:deoxyribose-phosphate aldolase